MDKGTRPSKGFGRHGQSHPILLTTVKKLCQKAST